MVEAPVRVLMVLTVRCAKNGITNSVANFVAGLDDARVRCDLVSPNEPEAQISALFTRTGGQVFVLKGRNRNPARYIRALVKIVRQREIEIVHAHGNSATLFTEMFAAKLGKAKVRIAHSHNSTCKMKWADRLLRKPFYRLCTDAMACSEAAGNWLFPNRDCVLLNNAVETERFRFNPEARSALRNTLGLADETLAILHIGAFNAQKNQSFLIGAFSEALKDAPQAVLLLAGDGDNRKDCEELALRLGVAQRVFFLGWRDDISELLSAADVFALPSLHEGLPLTLVEAQCAGLWSLASDRVTREAALTPLVVYCPIENTKRFAEALHTRRESERAAASENAILQLRAAGYDASENAERLMRHYERLAGRAGNEEI